MTSSLSFTISTVIAGSNSQTTLSQSHGTDTKCRVTRDQWYISPYGVDHYTTYPGFGPVLSHGFDPNCWPSGYESGKIYSTTECPSEYTPRKIEVNPYSTGSASDRARMITTATCCSHLQTEIVRLVPTGPEVCFFNGSGFTGPYIVMNDSEGNRIATEPFPRAFVDDYVVITYESPASVEASATVVEGSSQFSVFAGSVAASMPNPTTDNLSGNGTGGPRGLSTGAKIGIIVGALTIPALIAVVLLLLWRRRKRKTEAMQSSQDSYFKAELSGEGIPYMEADGSAALLEADGLGKPPEADAANVRAELESDWTGWEAPVLPESDQGRNMPDSTSVTSGHIRRRSGLRNSIQETPVDMVARR